MKKFKETDLIDALNIIKSSKNPVLQYFSELINSEFTDKKTFVKAKDSYIKTLTSKDVYFRPLKPEDIGYYKGMYGMFKKGSNVLLRRHTDLGLLGSKLKDYSQQ